MIPTFIRAYEAAVAIDGNLIVAYAAPTTGNTITLAGSATVPLVGVSDAMGADAGKMCDVHRGGLVPVKLGGAVSAGAAVALAKMLGTSSTIFTLSVPPIVSSSWSTSWTVKCSNSSVSSAGLVCSSASFRV